SKVLAGSNDANTGGDPVEAFTFTNTTGAAAKFNLMITRYGDGPDPGLVKYVTFDDPMQGVQFATNSGTVCGHANAAGALAVGAALMLQARPGATTLSVYSALQSTALDMGTPGFDAATGAGLIQAPNAVQALAAPVNVTLASTAPAVTNQAIPVAVTFSEP